MAHTVPYYYQQRHYKKNRKSRRERENSDKWPLPSWLTKKRVIGNLLLSFMFVYLAVRCIVDSYALGTIRSLQAARIAESLKQEELEKEHLNELKKSSARSTLEDGTSGGITEPNEMKLSSSAKPPISNIADQNDLDEDDEIPEKSPEKLMLEIPSISSESAAIEILKEEAEETLETKAYDEENHAFKDNEPENEGDGMSRSKFDDFRPSEVDHTSDETPVEKEWICPFEHPDKAKLYEPEENGNKPRYQTVREDKYLFSVSPFGPNNQLRGLRDSIMLAIYLNRTYVLPSFFKHSTDASYNEDELHNMQNANEKIDVYQLSQFVNIITMEELSKKGTCLDGMDFAVYARYKFGPAITDKLNAYTFKYNFKLLPDEYKANNDILEDLRLAPTQFFPGDLKETHKNKVAFTQYKSAGANDGGDKHGDQVEIWPAKESVEAAYGEKDGVTTFEKTCGFYVDPFKNLVWHKPMLSPRPSLEDREAKRLVHAMMRATGKSRAVRDGVDQ